MMSKYGCNNSDRMPAYFARNRKYSEGGWFITELMKIKDTSSKECRYDRRADDKKCEGCRK